MGMTENNSNSALIVAPNPFGDKIMFSTKNPEGYLFTIYNAAGVQVKKMRNATSWNGTDNSNNLLPKGIYFLKIEGKTNHLMKKIIFR
jgi:flagellar hook assembly protein FlgD